MPWERTGQRSTSRSRTRRSGWPAPSAPPGPPGRPSTLAGTGPASAASTTGTTASAACPPARPICTSSATAWGCTRASSCCSTRSRRTAPILPSESWSRSRRRRKQSDPLLGNPPPTALTHVFLRAPTADDHDLAITTVAGNIVPAVQGLRRSETFAIPDPATPARRRPPGVVRVGANWTPQDPQPDYRYCLTAGPLAWLATHRPGSRAARGARDPAQRRSWPSGSLSPWAFKRWLLDAGPADQVFTLTPEQYSPVLTSNGTTWLDYDGDGGTTIRFGDGTFGQSPRPGTQFSVVYRVGGGSAGNVAGRCDHRTSRPGQPQGLDHRLHQSFPGHRRRGRRDYGADPRPRAAAIQRRAAAGRAGQ